MAIVITIANQKGGVGKTTTAAAIAAGLHEKGNKVLIIDTDPQCNTSDTYQAQIDGYTTLYDILCNGASVTEAVQNTEAGDIVASDPLLSQAESLLIKIGKEYILKKALTPVLDKYDYVIIDTPPSLGILLVNGLTVADKVIVPITADRYSLQGLSQLSDTIFAAKEYTNPQLQIMGLLLTRFNSRTVLSREIAQDLSVIAEQLGTVVFDSKIRESTSAREAQAQRKNLFKYAPNCTTAKDYRALIEEVIERGC